MADPHKGYNSTVIKSMILSLSNLPKFMGEKCKKMTFCSFPTEKSWSKKKLLLFVVDVCVCVFNFGVFSLGTSV